MRQGVERAIGTIVAYLGVAISLNLAIYSLMNNFRYDCVA